MSPEIQKHLPIILAVGLLGGGFLLFRRSSSGDNNVVASNPPAPDNSAEIAASNNALQLEVLKIQAATALAATAARNALDIQTERDNSAIALTQIQANSQLQTAKALESTKKNQNKAAVISTGLSGLFNVLGKYYS